MYLTKFVLNVLKFKTFKYLQYEYIYRIFVTFSVLKLVADKNDIFIQPANIYSIF